MTVAGYAETTGGARDGGLQTYTQKMALVASGNAIQAIVSPNHRKSEGDAHHIKRNKLRPGGPTPCAQKNADRKVRAL
jgi:hypothetical protein